jgi:hypothetical protein
MLRPLERMGQGMDYVVHMRRRDDQILIRAMGQADAATWLGVGNRSLGEAVTTAWSAFYARVNGSYAPGLAFTDQASLAGVVYVGAFLTRLGELQRAQASAESAR